MNPKKLYIIRHGQTDYNKNGMVQGRGIDAPLNKEGSRQADLFYEKYASHPFDKIYISELQRTFQSVEKFIDTGIPYQKLSGLDEISWGTQEGQPFTAEAAKLYKKTIQQWTEGKLSVGVSNGESPLEVMRRQQLAMETILSAQEESQVLICMHGRAMRILLTWLVGQHLSEMEKVPHANLGLYIVSVTSDGFVIDQTNDISHLSGF